MARKILIAEDTRDMSDMMRNYLAKEGYVVYQAYDGREAISMARKVRPDLLLLDIMMPMSDGYEVCANLRVDMEIPIIIVTARVAEADKLKMFHLGADDYLTKPFSFPEMVWRVKAQLRRYYDFKKPVAPVRKHGKLTISTDRLSAEVDKTPLSLTAKEFKLLDFLTLNANQIFSKQKLLDAVWGYDEYVDEAAVTMAVSRLREKLSKVGVNNLETVWGFGYKWAE